MVCCTADVNEPELQGVHALHTHTSHPHHENASKSDTETADKYHAFFMCII